MAAIMKFLAVCALLSCFISQGYAQCDLSNIKITQNPTSQTVNGKPEYSVSIYSDCQCSQLNVYLDQTGFQTTETVDTNILSGDGLVNNGGLLPKDEATALKFNYAWDQEFAFKPAKSEIACSVARKLAV